MKKQIQRLIYKLFGVNFITSQLHQMKNLRADISNLCLQISREESARYVMKNMPKAKSFDSNEDLLVFGLASIADDLKQGLYLEFGVFTGNSINKIAEKTKGKVYGFDSFEGLPESWRTGFERGAFSLNHKTLPDVHPNVQLVVGWFEDTLPEFIEKNRGDIAILHIDCDLYSSTKTIFSYLGDRLVKNSIIVFDEYFGYPTWQDHEFLAFQEFIKTSERSYEYLGYNSSHEQVVVRMTN